MANDHMATPANPPAVTTAGSDNSVEPAGVSAFLINSYETK